MAARNTMRPSTPDRATSLKALRADLAPRPAGRATSAPAPAPAVETSGTDRSRGGACSARACGVTPPARTVAWAEQARPLREDNMRRVVLLIALLALTLAFVAGTYAAAKSYQFTGVVKAVDGGTLT